MEWTCLLVDCADSGLAKSLQEQVSRTDFGIPVNFVATASEAMAQISAGTALVLVIFAKDTSLELQNLLKSYQNHMGCISEFQAIVCDEPDPKFMAAVFEFGVEQFLSMEQWADELAGIVRHALSKISDPESPESKAISLARTVRGSDRAAIHAAQNELGDLADYDYRVAYAKAKACEASGNYSGAVSAFTNAAGLNKMFRPSSTGLGETLLVMGRVDEALEIFKKLEKTNLHDVERKANLASAYIEKGDFEAAMKYVNEADTLAPGSSKVLEAKAQVLLCTGKVADAFKLMDGMSEVGPFFAAKLNELGIKLSQVGKGKSALALYQKAHKIVRAELKYKISMNAALACRRLKEWDMALKYLTRCEREYGGAFEKSEKIRQAILEGKAQDKVAPVTKAS